MTSKLGDLFPEDIRKERAKRVLTKGAVLRLFSRDIKNQKIKRLIIIGFAEGNVIGKVYVNSNPQSKNSQLELMSSSRDYLEHDSYVDCSRIYENDYLELCRTLKDDPDCYLGLVSSEDMELIENELKIARTIPRKQKRRYGLID